MQPEAAFLFGFLFNTKDEKGMFLQNVHKHLKYYIVLHPKIQLSLYTTDLVVKTVYYACITSLNI
jgi:hypothetical protein